MDTQIRRTRRTRWLMVLLAAAMGLTTIHCALPTDPGMPRWDVPFAIPFSEATYGLDSLVSKPAEIDSNGSGILVMDDGIAFWFSDSIPTTTIDPRELAFELEQADSFVVQTDTLVLPSQGNRAQSMPLGPIYTAASLPTGTNLPIIPAMTIPAAQQFVTFDGFDSLGQVHVVAPDGGALDITFVNNTPLTWETLRLEVQINDSVNFPTLGNPIEFLNVAPGQEQTQVLDLSGEWLQADLRFEVTGSSAAATNVTLNASDEFLFNIFLGEIRCDIAEAILPRQEVVAESYTMELNQEDWITSAIIDSGYIYFEVMNQTEVGDSVIVTFSDFIHLTTGDTLDFPLYLAPNSAFIDSFDLANYELVLDMPEHENDTQGLTARTSVILLGTPEGTGYSTISAGDTVKTKYYTGDLTFRSFSGVPKAISFDVGNQSQDLDLFGDQADLQQDLVGKLLLNDVHVDVHLNNTYDVPVLLTLNMDAYNSTADAPFDHIHQVFVDTLSQNTTLLRIPNIEDLVNILPDRIDFSVTIQTGRDYFQPSPPYVARTITVNDSVSGWIEIVAPFALTINDTTILRPVPTQMQQPLEAPLTNFKLITALTNSVPVNGAVYLMAGSFITEQEARDALILDNCDLYSIMTPLHIPVPEISIDGRPIAAATDTLVTEIDEAALERLAEENVWVRQVLVLYPTVDEFGNLVAVSMSSSDAITVSIVAEATIAVNGDNETGE